MTWVKLDDGFSENPKVLRISNAALRLHINAMCWAARNLSDGEIPPHALPMLRGSKKLSVELVEAGLWETTSRSGFVVHDFLEYNPSRAEVEAEREKKRTAGKAGGQASAQARASRSGSEFPQAKSNPVPVPVPVPLSASNEAQGAAVAAVSRKGVDEDFLLELQDENPTVNVRQVYERAKNRKTWDGYKDKRRALRDHVGYALEDQRKVNSNGHQLRTNPQSNHRLAGTSTGPERVPDMVIGD